MHHFWGLIGLMKEIQNENQTSILMVTKILNFEQIFWSNKCQVTNYLEEFFNEIGYFEKLCLVSSKCF